MFKKYDVIVVGAGHAGCEAAWSAAKMGSKVLLATMNMQTIAQMSCNPAMGGIAKGQIVREIDALGGMSGIVSDKSAIQFRMLNMSKGPAMWSPRTQNDRMLFAEEWRMALESNKNIDFWQEMISGLIIKNNQVKGIRTSLGIEIESDAVVLTNGTFLNGLIHIGEKTFGGGRTGELAAKGITEQLVSLGFEAGRMKTGTPPRLDGRSLNYERMEEQKGDAVTSKFSYSSETMPLQKQKSCYITYTNSKVHDVLRTGFEKSPMFTGRIKGLGPRYCPSVEDKITRFADKDRHQIFVEPEGWNTVEIYVNGFSTSLPEDVQYNALKQIEGFEDVKMFRPGYAIEYDYFPPTQLNLTLETKQIQNLYFAGQINGTTGYEEAACQGLMAGINAHQKINNKEPFILARSEAYIGVLIDDLVNKGTDEPYRMFTSRAEFRILLRQDNADLRLSDFGYNIGCLSEKRYGEFVEKKQHIETITKSINTIKLNPNIVNPILDSLESSTIKEKTSLSNLLKRPNIEIQNLNNASQEIEDLIAAYTNEEIQQSVIQLKYHDYIIKEQELVKKMTNIDSFKISENFDYSSIIALSSESKQKLNKIKPLSLGQASRISGVTPSDISIIMIYLSK